MKVQVLGPGCMKCNKLYAEAEKAIAHVGISVELEKVDKIEEIMNFGVVFTPALVIDGDVKSAGSVPNADQIESWILEASSPK